MHIHVLIEPGKTVPLYSLPKTEQKEILNQIKMVSEISNYDVAESDELLFSNGGLNGK